MRIVGKYSHQNGEEFLLSRKPELWEEIQEVISGVDAEACKTKVSQESMTMGKMLYSPPAMNKAFKEGFTTAGWQEKRFDFWVTGDNSIMEDIRNLRAAEQKKQIENAGLTPIKTYNQIDFVKERVAVEVQFGKYAFVAHDLFVKLLSFYLTEQIDVGIEILPMKELESQMSSGVPYFERDHMNLLRHGRGVMAMPLVLIGVIP